MKKIILILLVLMLLLDFAIQSFAVLLTQKVDSDKGEVISSVQIYYPKPNTTTRSNIVYGRIPEDAVRVTVNGEEAKLFYDREVFIARPSFKQGKNTMTVQAEDASGNIIKKSQISFTYDTIAPKVTITSPLDDSTINISPIKVTGKNAVDLKSILINHETLAYIEKDSFKVDWIDLEPTEKFQILEVSGFDQYRNEFSDAVLLKTPQLVDYMLIAESTSNITGKLPVPGSNQTLKVKLLKNYKPAINEKVQFKVTEGKGTLSQPSVFTNADGEATVTLTTDKHSAVKNVVECYPENNPLEKISISIYTEDE